MNHVMKDPLNNKSINNRTEEILRTSYDFKPKDDNLIKAKKENRKNKLSLKIFCFALAFVATAVFLGVCYTKIFVLDTVTVENCTAYSAEEIIENSTLNLGGNLHEFNKKDINNSLCKNLAYIKSVDVKRVWPNKISLIIYEETPSTYISLCNNYYIISDDLKVLKKETDKQKLEDMKLMHVRVDNVENCIVGEKIHFEDSDIAFILEEIIENMKKSGIIKFCEDLDIRNKFDITFEYKTRFTVRLGDGYDTDMKLDFMKAIEEKMYESDKGIIDVSDNSLKEASVIRK